MDNKEFIKNNVNIISGALVVAVKQLSELTNKPFDTVFIQVINDAQNLNQKKHN